MKCQKCGADNANTHVKTIVNGEFKEFDLCADCAHKMGYTNVFSDFENEFSGFLGSFFGNVLPARTQATRCEFCGSPSSECYELFADRLYPSIRRIHGNTTHCGKNSPSAKAEKAKPEPTKEDKISQLKTELDKAVEQQNFERAAELRDQIKGMEA